MIAKIKKIQAKVVSLGFKPLFTKYTGSKHKLKVQCKCGRVFFATISSMSNSKSCGHCNDPKVGERFNKLTITKVIPSPGGGCSVECVCDCGNRCGPYTLSTIKGGNTTSCGHCNDFKVGDTIHQFVITDIIYSGNSKGSKVMCKCACGNRCGPYKTAHLRSDNTKSCGRCNNPNIGDKFGMLTIIKVTPSFSHGCQVEAKCECGKIIGPFPITVITRIDKKGQVSCGNCKLKRNGVATSYKALELQNIIEGILDDSCEHNYKIGSKCFDIVNLNSKTVIEYDEYYWHRIVNDTTKKEIKDTNIALNNGFKILRIRASNDLPTKQELTKVLLNHFQHNIKEYIITMPSWVEASKCLID